MATINRFEELEVWQEARLLNKSIWQLTQKEDFKSYFSLNEQLRRASISIMNNISEGFDRNGNKEFVQFLSIAKGNTAEVKNMLYALLDLELISQKEFEELSQASEKLRNKIAKLMNYLKTSDFKGSKFQLSKH